MRPAHAARRRPDLLVWLLALSGVVAFGSLLLPGASAAATELAGVDRSAGESAVVAPMPAVPAPGAPAPSAPASASTTSSTDDPVEITLFWGEGCSSCAAEKRWLAELAAEYPVDVTELEVWQNPENRDRWVAAGEEIGFAPTSVPTTIIDQRVWIGFNDGIASDIENTVQLVLAGQAVPSGLYGSATGGTCSEDDLTCTPGEETGATITVPLAGTISLDNQSLLVSTIIIGFVDGVNPCSLWVISVLLTIVIRTASRRRVVAIGTTFLIVTAAMYGLFMAGIYSALTVIGFLGWVQVVVGLAAGIFAVVSIKDYFAFKKGLSFTISDSAKPGIYKRVREAAGHHKLIPALAATVVLGGAVSLLEAPCTAGFPVLWTGLLHANNVGPAETVGLFAAYMIPYLLDEMIVFGVAVATMRAAKFQERHGELLKLFAGVTMLALAAVMLVEPSLMENPILAMGLFAIAFAAALVVHLVTVRVRGARAARQDAEGSEDGDLTDPDDAAVRETSGV